MVPGRPVANMYGAMYGAHPLQQGIAFLQDLKLGQYCKLAPRITFSMQILGTVVGAILNCKCFRFPIREYQLTFLIGRHHDAHDH